MLKNNKSSQACEERYRQLFEHMSSGVAVYEATENGEDFIFIDFNKAAETIEGIRKDELLGKKVTEVFPGVIEFGLFEVFRRVWLTGAPTNHPISEYKDGRISGWRDNYVYKLPTGEIVAIYDDVTKIKQAEEASNLQKQQLETIIKASKTGLWDWDLRTDEVYFSPEWKQQIGYEDHEISNDFSEWQSRVHPDDMEKTISKVQEFIKNPSPDNENEFRFQHKNGTYIWILAKSSLIEDEKGNPIRMLGSHLDITKRKQVEEELSQIFTMSLDMICIADINTATFIKVNPSFTEVLGYSEEELLNKPIVDFIHLDDIDSTFAVIEQKLQSGTKVINFENRYRCKDGTYRWLSWVSHPDANKGVTYAIARDITEKKEYEKAVEESQALLEATSRMANVGGWELDLNTQEVLWTHMTGKIHELPEGLQPPLEEAINFYHPDDREMVAEYVNQAVEEGIPYEFEARLITYKGRQRWVRAIGKPTMEGGKCVKLSGTFQDITERKQAEEKIINSQQRYQRLTDNSPDMIYRMSLPDGIYEYVSPAAEEITGYTPEEFYESPTLIKNILHPDWVNYFNEEWEKLIAGSTPPNYEYQIIHKSGEVKWLNQRNVLIKDESEKPAAIEGIVTDITALKVMEKEKERLNEQLHQSQKMEAVGTMAGGIAHDFNNILTIISGNAEIALDDIPAGNPAGESIEEILQASRRASDLVRQILTFSRKEKKELVPIAPQSLIKETLKLLRSLTPTTVSIVQDISGDCGRIMADPTGLHQLLMNLFANGVHAMDEKGEMTVSLKEVALKADDFARLPYTMPYLFNKPGKYARLSVTDTGTGMNRETVKKVFDPFYTTKEVGKGTGMGLSVVHGIVESHGGFIAVDSNPGHGSTFSVYIPVTEEVEEEFFDDESEASAVTGTERILLVDDEESLLVLTKRILDKLGYAVTAESNSLKALDKFKADPDQFDLVITDQAMPNMSGTELVAEIVKVRPGIPVILCTGFSTKVSAKNAGEMGISKFINKPYTKKSLPEAVREVLNGKL